MPTVVDSLIVTLGLDPSDFEQERKNIAASWLKTKDEFKKGGKDIEDTSKRASDSIDKITKSALGLLAVLVGARGFKDFAVGVTQTDSALGRMSTNLGMSAQNLARWQGAAVRAGGSAEGAAASVQAASDQLLGLRNNGTPLPTSLARLFSDTGITPNLTGSTEQYLGDIGRAAAIERQKRGAQQTAYLLQQAGLGGLTNLLIQGNVQGQLAQTPAPSDSSIANAQDLLARWTKLQQTFGVNLGNAFMDFEPAFRPFMDDLQQLGDWIGKNEPSIKAFATDAAGVANSLGQWRVVLEALVALWAGGKLVGMIGAVRSLLGFGAAGTAGAVGAGEVAAAGATAASAPWWAKLIAGAASTGAGAAATVGGLAGSIWLMSTTGAGSGEDALVHRLGLTNASGTGDEAAYIRAKAIALGIDPDVALSVAAHEGLNSYTGDDGSSFGPFQLHMGRISGQFPQGGLGDSFMAATGLDPRDPSTMKAQIDFALQYAKTNGWGSWMGAAAAGITGFQGISPTTIGQINITVPGGDANKIAGSIGPAIQRAKIAQPANSGPM